MVFEKWTNQEKRKINILAITIQNTIKMLLFPKKINKKNEKMSLEPIIDRKQIIVCKKNKYIAKLGKTLA